MTRLISLILILVFNMSAFDGFKIFNKDGKERDAEDILEDALESEIILFGELHNNPIAHYLQYKLLKEIHAEDSTITIGAEMFESDDQIVIDEFLNGKIRLKDLEKEAKIWNNFATDYRMFLEFADNKNLNFIATNIPRRYASLLAREGVESLVSLPDDAKKYICPLPFEYDEELPGYKAMAGMGAGHGMPHIAQSQAIKDATMAYFIHQNFKNRFYHLNGAYHSNNYEAINWYLKKLNPNYKILTISVVEQDDLEDLLEDNKGLADYIIVVDSDMPKSY